MRDRSRHHRPASPARHARHARHGHGDDHGFGRCASRRLVSRRTWRFAQPPDGPASPFAPDTPRGQFLARWLEDLDPLLRTWLLASVRRESAARACGEADEAQEEDAADLLLIACAEAHGLGPQELRWLVPTIEMECLAFVRTALRGERDRADR